MHARKMDGRDKEQPMARQIPETSPDYEETRLIERPDGFYWQSKVDGREYGPFPTLIEAAQDMERNDDSSFEAGETLEEAEAEIGIADWIDPDTGEPGEGPGPRTEQH
jgi:hypothetical protein